MPGHRWKDLVEVANSQYGYVTPADARSVGANRDYLDHLTDRDQVHRVARGLYRIPSVPVADLDPYMEAVLWVGEDAVVSHDSVLALHNLAYANPKAIRVTTPRRVRKSDPPLPIEIITRKLHPGEITYFEGIPCTTVARALVDSRGLVMRDRLVAAAHEALDEGLLLKEEFEQAMRSLEVTNG